MAYLPVGDPLAQIWGKPRCVSLLGRFINLHRITSFMYFPCTFPYQGWCTYESMIWIRRAILWCSWPLATVWWLGGVESIFPGSITLSCIQQSHSSGNVPPCNNWCVFHIIGLTPWREAHKISHCLPCRCKPWAHVRPRGVHALPLPGGYPQLRFPSWVGNSSSMSND